MAQLRIYSYRGGGLSSGFLAQKVRAVVKRSKVNAIIEAKSESEVTQHLSKMDILCIGSHYEFRLKVFEDMAALYNIPVIVVPEEIYSMLNGKALFQLAVGTLEKYKV